jgi:hypothetical protein
MGGMPGGMGGMPGGMGGTPPFLPIFLLLIFLFFALFVFLTDLLPFLLIPSFGFVPSLALSLNKVFNCGL